MPLTNQQSIGEFVNQYGLLKNVQIQLLSTNNELDNNGFFQQAREEEGKGFLYYNYHHP